MNKKPYRDNESSGRGRRSDGGEDKRGSDRKRGGSGFSKGPRKDGRGGFLKGDRKNDRSDYSKRNDREDSRGSGRSYGSRDDRGSQKRYNKEDGEKRGFGRKDSDEGRRDFKGSRDNKRSFERGDDKRRGGKSRFDNSDRRRNDRDSSGDRRKSYERDDRQKKYDKDNSRNKRRSDDRNDRREKPGLKKTRTYKEKDQELIGNWREDLPDERKNNRSRPSKERHSEPRIIDEEIRLNRFIANSGLCSRREADEFIANGSVTVNGVVVKELGVRVQPGDEVRFKGRQVLPEKAVYLLMNKPKDCITSLDDQEGRKTVMDLLEDEVPERVFPVGRLDRNTTGVLLLTNDGDLSQKLTHPSYGVHKVYKADLNKALTKADMETLLAGVELEDGKVNFDEIAYLDESKSVLGVEIHSGKNRVIHRMFNSLGYLVDKLDRVSFAGLTKDKVKRGEFRYLTEKEVRLLFKESGKKMA